MNFRTRPVDILNLCHIQITTNKKIFKNYSTACIPTAGAKLSSTGRTSPVMQRAATGNRRPPLQTVLLYRFQNAHTAIYVRRGEQHHQPVTSSKRNSKPGELQHQQHEIHRL